MRALEEEGARLGGRGMGQVACMLCAERRGNSDRSMETRLVHASMASMVVTLLQSG